MSDVRFITTPEVAKLAGLTARHVQRLAESGEIPTAQRNGTTKRGHWRFSPNDAAFRKWVDASKPWNERPRYNAKRHVGERRRIIALHETLNQCAPTTPADKDIAFKLAEALQGILSSKEELPIACGMIDVLARANRIGLLKPRNRAKADGSFYEVLIALLPEA